ncbi:hypothetical protein DSM104299_03832 [Baekduia alba]|uniref:hypothetical protein n=1 Tax=Baekduia alba TaxID=2997333 RepID=UPI0023420DFB|nr:hypothetical protein [Baekduia alba]WCB95090.1 hypothetical protein DSM104299_03832 [Baekduia alba]
MTATSTELGDARLLVEARLGREPQDLLEAAVVLEAWAGMPAQAALAAASATMPAALAAAQPSVGRLPRGGERDGVLADGAAFLLTVVAIACWAAPLTTSVGLQAVERALVLALPLTLALQRALGSRFLDRPQGIAQLARHRLLLLAGAVAVVALPALALGTGGLLAGLLTVTWTGGTVLIRRRWPAVYVLIILLATAAMLSGAPALEVVAAAAAATLLAAAVALRPSPAVARRSLGAGEPVAVAGAIGVGLGVMLVLDRTVSWTDGAVPALALIPSTLAALLAGHHLRHLELAIPKALSGVAVDGTGTRRLGRCPTRVLLGALGRLLALSAALSAPLLWLSPWLGGSARGAGVLTGFALVALASMLVGLLESLGRGRWALVAVVCGAAAEAAVWLGDVDPFPGAGLVVGGLVVALLVLPVVVARLRRPATTLATSLWIP